MTKPSRRTRPPKRCAPQLPIAFPTKGPLEHNARAEAVALLSRLLLQVANALVEREAPDEPS
jgi:hypothetical protein